MKIKLLILALFPLLFFTACPQKRIMVISIGGSSLSDLHERVQECSREYGYVLTQDENYIRESAGAVAYASDSERIRDAINVLVSRNGGDKSDLSLLIVGKSAGGVLAWDTFRRQYGEIDDFHRAALVLVDPHGAVYGDDRTGAYSRFKDLWWPSNWSSNTDFLRVYNIYQHRVGPTGASFPDDRVYRSTQLNDDRIDHFNITSRDETSGLIKEALNFVWVGR